MLCCAKATALFPQACHVSGKPSPLAVRAELLQQLSIDLMVVMRRDRFQSGKRLREGRRERRYMRGGRRVDGAGRGSGSFPA
jgi:hypothetical protein